MRLYLVLGLLCSTILPITVNYTYDYSDRSYTLTTDTGDTINVTYGDTNLTIVQGDTTTVLNYYVESAAPTTPTYTGDDTGWKWWQDAWNSFLTWIHTVLPGTGSSGVSSTIEQNPDIVTGDSSSSSSSSSSVSPYAPEDYDTSDQAEDGFSIWDFLKAIAKGFWNFLKGIFKVFEHLVSNFLVGLSNLMKFGDKSNPDGAFAFFKLTGLE